RLRSRGRPGFATPRISSLGSSQDSSGEHTMIEHVLPKHRVAAGPVLCFLDIPGSKPKRSTGSLLFEDNQRGKGLGSEPSLNSLHLANGKERHFKGKSTSGLV